MRTGSHWTGAHLLGLFIVGASSLGLGCGTRREPLVVAPNEPPPRELVVDDDGPAEYRSINDAIAAARTGMTVRVRPGLYRELIELRSGVSVVGAGREETTVEFARDAAVVIGRNVRGVRLSGLRLQHEQGAGPCGSPVILCTGCRDLVVSDSEILGSGYEGILLNRARGVRIERNRIAENEWAGVEVLRSTDVTIAGNEIDGNGVAVAVAGASVRIEDSSLGRPIAGHAPLVVAPIPTLATTVTVARVDLPTTIVDFTVGGFEHVQLEDVDCGFSPIAVEVREIVSPRTADDEGPDVLSDWMHSNLVAWNWPHGLGLGASRHLGYRTCDGTFDGMRPGPPDSVYNGGRPVGDAPLPVSNVCSRLVRCCEDYVAATSQPPARAGVCAANAQIVDPIMCRHTLAGYRAGLQQLGRAAQASCEAPPWTASEMNRLVGSWEGGRPDPDETIELDVRNDGGVIAGSLTVTGGETWSCPIVVVESPAESRGPLVSFRCVYQTFGADEGDPIIADDSRCVLALTEAGALRFASPTSGPACNWSGVVLVRSGS